MIVKQCNRQKKHENWTDNPVLHQRQAQYLPIAKYVAQFLVLYFGQRGIHHEDQTHGDRYVGCVHLEVTNDGFHAGYKVSGPNADRHCQEDPQRQVSIKK